MRQLATLQGEQADGDIDRWLGRRDAFALVAGRCSAAAAESLRRLRDEKIYKRLYKSWEEFCKKRLGISRRHIDRTIRLLDEFGPEYFHVAQMAHVTPEEYRAIAPHVSADGVRLDGAVVALLPENSEQVSAAVAELLERAMPVTEKAALSFDAVVKRCESVTAAVEQMEGELEPVQKLCLTTAISRLRRAAARKGAQTL